MFNINEVIETNKMIHEMNLDVRTITMGISLLDCVSESLMKYARIFTRRLQQRLRIL